MKKFLIVIFGFLLVLYACGGGAYVFSLDSFPPDSKPHENNWTHIFKIVTYWKHEGGFTQIGEKEINIYIVDNKKNVLFKGQFKIIAGGIDREILWDDFDKISCRLFSYQTEGSGETLKKSDSTIIAELEFEYNHHKKNFEKKTFTIKK